MGDKWGDKDHEFQVKIAPTSCSSNNQNPSSPPPSIKSAGVAKSSSPTGWNIIVKRGHDDNKKTTIIEGANRLRGASEASSDTSPMPFEPRGKAKGKCTGERHVLSSGRTRRW